jgi:broad specificity phosphatase PhoE
MNIISKPFYLIRHAETTENVKFTACGSLDPPLTQAGKEKAIKLSIAFNNYLENINFIYHSYLKRSISTAIIFKDKKQIELKGFKGINEQNFGLWEGRPWDQVLKKLQNKESPPYGESRKQYTNRVINSLDYIINEHKANHPPILIAHGGTFFALGYAFGFNIVDIPNCQISYFEPKENAKKNDIPWDTYNYEFESNQLIKTDLYYK